jgi:hypothetical protein
MFACLQKSASSKRTSVCIVHAVVGTLEQFPHTGSEKLLFILSNFLSASIQGSGFTSQMIATNIQPN